MQPGGAGPSWISATSGELQWMDIQDPTPEDMVRLSKQYPFHPLNLEDCLSKRQLPRVEDHDSYLFILMHFPSVSGDGIVSRDQVSMFVGPGYVVSIHGSALGVVREMAEAAKSRAGRSDSKSPARLVYAIVDGLVDRMFPLLDKLRDELDSVEDEVFHGKISVAGKINDLRRRIADMRRIVLPLRRTRLTRPSRYTRTQTSS